jgi:signal transduction histidine kinase
VTARTARRLARASWAVAVVSALGALVFVVAVEPVSIVTAVFLLLATVAYASVGTLIASRHSSNPIGWLFVAVGACLGLASLGMHYAGVDDPSLAWAKPAGAATILLLGLVLPFALPMFLMLFPEGTLLSRRWRPALWTAAVAAVVFTLGLFASPSTARLLDTPDWVRRIPGVGGFVAAGSALIAGATVAGFASLVIRYRRAAGDERQHVKWLTKMLAAMVIASAVALAASAIGSAFGADFLWLVFFPATLVVLFGVLIGIPAATAIAVLTFGLYDVGVVLKKTIVYGLLVAGMGLFLAFVLFFLSPLALGSGGNEGGAVGRTVSGILIVVLAFAATWGRLKRIARRAVFGRRSTPYEVIGEFTERLGESYSTDDVLPRTAEILRASTGADIARVWLRVGDELRPAATSPAMAPPAEPRIPSAAELPELPGRSFPVRHQGELLGAFTVEMPASEPLSATSERLATDLAAQAGLVLRNVRLTEELKETIEELRASRQRIVTAQDERARKLERDIHDGAQQQLVALSVKLRLAEQVGAKDPEKARSLYAELQKDATDALDNLRDLARGIYPPLLADRGLVAALEAQSGKAPVPVKVEPDGVGRYAQEIEAAVYFCCLEALQNVGKYANATSVTVRLSDTNGDVTFDVTDDGEGFDPATTPSGSGLTNMRDRLEALGGTLAITSLLGEGTTVAGRVPVQEGP